MIAVLSKYGYHGSNHLVAMMIDDDRRKADTEYMATALWSIGRMLGGDQYNLPLYDDFIHPRPTDDRTSHDIVNGLIDKLGKGDTGQDASVRTFSGGG